MLRRDYAIDISRYVSACEDFNQISVLSLISASIKSLHAVSFNKVQKGFLFTKMHCICQGEIVKFSDYQKTELGKEVEVKSTSTRSPPPQIYHLHQITTSNKSPSLPNNHLHQITSPHPPP